MDGCAQSSAFERIRRAFRKTVVEKNEKLSVGLVTADTYRISAVDQLRTYAEILGARLEIASDPSTMRAAIERCGDLDAVLVDTPGRSQNDADRLAELRAIVDAARPHETHLVLSGTASERVLLREAEAFSSLGPDRVVLTKLVAAPSRRWNMVPGLGFLHEGGEQKEKVYSVPHGCGVWVSGSG